MPGERLTEEPIVDGTECVCLRTSAERVDLGRVKPGELEPSKSGRLKKKRQFLLSSNLKVLEMVPD